MVVVPGEVGELPIVGVNINKGVYIFDEKVAAVDFKSLFKFMLILVNVY